MLNPKSLDDLTSRIADALPKGLRGLGSDVEKTLRAGIEGALARMDLVTREEFEIQTQVLSHTRAKLESLQQQLDQLEHERK